ncbi:hypothetical protein N3C_2330 [Clostridium sp. N3C]|uniref:hypothetical protein n=1 Tax=Clostridium sp. N3C TaxID=1776758 RepID=UPI00092DF913|nr:hypothetical protein [Clostridium sp. N3C]SCN25465.1 hypothetical protein N3C_2330 [Clostridium sp. N3C]
MKTHLKRRNITFYLLTILIGASLGKLLNVIINKSVSETVKTKPALQTNKDVDFYQLMILKVCQELVFF